MVATEELEARAAARAESYPGRQPLPPEEIVFLKEPVVVPGLAQVGQMVQIFPVREAMVAMVAPVPPAA